MFVNEATYDHRISYNTTTPNNVRRSSKTAVYHHYVSQTHIDTGKFFLHTVRYAAEAPPHRLPFQAKYVPSC